MGSEIFDASLEHLIVPVLTAIATAIVGFIAAAGRRALNAIATKAEATTHALDVALLASTLQRKAVAAVADPTTPEPTPAELVAYLERVRGDLLAKMNPAPEALETMAQAAIATASATSPPAP